MEDNKVSLFTAILINISLMVGAGIFIYPMYMAQEAGSWSFLGWPLAALIFLPLVVSIAEVSRLFPQAGSFYTYSKQTLGKAGGFMSGWLYLLGYLSVGAIHSLALKNILGNDMGISMVKNYPAIFFVPFITLLCYGSLFKLDTVGKLQSMGTFFKMLPLLFIAMLLPFLWGKQTIAPHFSIETIGSLINIIPYTIFGFWGFEVACNISHRIRGSKKNASRAILIGFASTVAIYAVFHLGLIHLMGTEHLANRGVRAFAEFLPSYFANIQWLMNVIMRSAIAMAHITVAFGVFLTGSPLIHSMAEENLIFLSPLLRKTNLHDQPYFAIIMQALVIFTFLILLPHIPSLTAITNIGILFSFMLTLISLVCIQTKMGNIFGALTTCVAFISCLIIIYYSIQLIKPFTNLIPLAVIAILGIVMFYWQTKQLKAF